MKKSSTVFEKLEKLGNKKSISVYSLQLEDIHHICDLFSLSEDSHTKYSTRQCICKHTVRVCVKLCQTCKHTVCVCAKIVVSNLLNQLKNN